MLLRQGKKLVIKFFTGVAIISAAGAHSETGTLVHVVTYSSSKTSPIFFQQKSDFEEQDKFYKNFFGKTDKQVEDIYNSRWAYHDGQVPYSLTSWRNEHLSRASLANGGQAPYEGDVRKDFATQVLRMRMDSGIRALLYEIKSPTLQKVAAGYQQTMDRIRNYPLRLSNKKNSKAGELRIGYDVLSDSSKIEYVQGVVEAGLYHPYLFGMLTKAKPGMEIASLNVSSNLGTEVPKATVSYPLSGKTIEAALSKSLSPSVSARFVSGQPLRDSSAPHRYEAQVAYTF